ncbi:hypothetical protein GLOTRDRAFT_90677 [Gloeophyllum trabeum ATCC 11539]|uniref:Uncharacterized protein n=1 Tax=Gloeophyllum trabeum (strain ATCC 11539 / FP-39264 / Madison 617) TaxID=670483 RepID=S7RVT0_GLOTA|nr:uncharacterized protein GLOTRDRAFT_90677 [Gloeophyllum trabeum ATCC 11539]EPQ58925.1 hypothetical protein GLOTRDRAFT_90677 [Gloeophyllum trabeum ATCC 11539]
MSHLWRSASLHARLERLDYLDGLGQASGTRIPCLVRLVAEGAKGPDGEASQAGATCASMTTSAVDVFSYVAGVISLIALAYTASRGYLPSVRMKELQEVLEDTENILHGAVEAGYLRNPWFISKVRYKLSWQVVSLEAQVRSATRQKPLRHITLEGVEGAICRTITVNSEAARRHLDNEGQSDPTLQQDYAEVGGEDRIALYAERVERARPSRRCRVPARSASCPPSLHINITNPVTHLCEPLGEGQSQAQAAERDSGRPEALHYGTDSDDVSVASLFEPPPILSDEEPDSVPGLTVIGSTASLRGCRIIFNRARSMDYMVADTAYCVVPVYGGTAPEGIDTVYVENALVCQHSSDKRI